ncbi:hypothetical protein ALC62_00354 [Cyphomyrmex costatus]|uniref:Uncharacterized protein n=1 Tax=Cyphomyrmex costatus TaxID=456900 RepID=A0A195D746_9HYME|nr:hypothetical protein ALC62_00354 [Cyphomyrmex costatus]
MTHVLLLSVIFGVCCTLAEKSEYTTTTTENSEKLSNSKDQFLASAIRGKNSSELALDNIDEEEIKKTDKKPRTVLHRDSSLERDKYGWQTQVRPPGSIGNGDRPGAGSGSAVYAGSQSGDRYGPRPASDSNRPITLGYGSGNGGGYGYVVSGYGGYGRPTGHGGSISGYGISGTLADGDEFGPNDAAYPDVSTPQGNIQAQKAIALKALAGVALIGAAAALASNPVFLPIGIVSGRRKRSETFSEKEQTDYQMDYILYMLKENLAKIRKDSSSGRLVISPRCVARLTCEIQKDYLSDVGKDVEILSTNRKYHLTDLIRNNVLNTNTVSVAVKDLIELAVGVAAKNESCDTFTCNYIRKAYK